MSGATFDPTRHKVFVVRWALEGTSLVVAENEIAARRTARSEWNAFDLNSEDLELNSEEVTDPAQVDPDDVVVGPAKWGRQRLSVEARMELIQRPMPPPETITELRRLTDLEWLALAVNYDGVRPWARAVSVSNGRSAATDGWRMHVVDAEVREPGLWDVVTGEAAAGQFPDHASLVAELLADMDGRVTLGDLAGAWVRIRHARDEGAHVSLLGPSGAEVTLDAGYLLDALAGAALEDGGASSVILGPARESAALAVLMPEARRTALVMPIRSGSHGRRDRLEVSS